MECLLRIARVYVLVIDAPMRIKIAGTGCGAAFRRRAELLQMDVADAGFVERGRKLALGKAWPARGCHRARIDQKIDFGAIEFLYYGRRFCLLVANRKQSQHLRVTGLIQHLPI